MGDLVITGGRNQFYILGVARTERLHAGALKPEPTRGPNQSAATEGFAHTRVSAGDEVIHGFEEFKEFKEYKEFKEFKELPSASLYSLYFSNSLYSFFSQPNAF